LWWTYIILRMNYIFLSYVGSFEILLLHGIWNSFYKQQAPPEMPENMGWEGGRIMWWSLLCLLWAAKWTRNERIMIFIRGQRVGRKKVLANMKWLWILVNSEQKRSREERQWLGKVNSLEPEPDPKNYFILSEIGKDVGNACV
jgi:hypothetical protein